MKKITVAIDGPAGAGKSTVAKIVAEKLGCTYIDTGAMYRAVAYEILTSQKNIEQVLDEIDLELIFENGSTKVFSNGKDISEVIRQPEISKLVPKIAAMDLVRTKLVDMQRQMSSSKSVVLDGRDIGTVVLPNADVKIYLTASIEERAHRRFEELKSKNIPVDDIKTLELQIASRDRADMEREISPLRQAEDAILIDSTNLEIDQVAEKILDLVRKIQV